VALNVSVCVEICMFCKESRRQSAERRMDQKSWDGKVAVRNGIAIQSLPTLAYPGTTGPVVSSFSGNCYVGMNTHRTHLLHSAVCEVIVTSAFHLPAYGQFGKVKLEVILSL
jgi:hypothetical protein